MTNTLFLTLTISQNIQQHVVDILNELEFDGKLTVQAVADSYKLFNAIFNEYTIGDILARNCADLYSRGVFEIDYMYSCIQEWQETVVNAPFNPVKVDDVVRLIKGKFNNIDDLKQLASAIECLLEQNTIDTLLQEL